jgi:N-acetylmuramic acid 6-phosphate etherase
MLNLDTLITESRNPLTYDLDIMTPLEIVKVMNTEDKRVPEAVSEYLPQIALAIDWATESLKNGGRIIYLGSGTSGRLGIMDAVECPPTFGTSPDMVIGLIAGGESAFTKAMEGAEDNYSLGEEDLKKIGLTNKDIVIGISASGRTPYVVGGLKYANLVGCHTVAIANNKDSEIGKIAQLTIDPEVGPEILTGSTRLKAGTSQKMILNMISTGSMVGIGKVYENLMVDVVQNNKKLETRAQNIVIEATGVSRERASKVLDAAGGEAKTAILMILLGCDADTAKEKLKKSEGHLRKACSNI